MGPANQDPENTDDRPDLAALPARTDLQTMQELEDARKAYEKRVNQRLEADGRALVEVRYAIDETRLQDLQDHHKTARYDDKHGMALVEHRPDDQPTRWLCHTLLTSIEQTTRHQSVRDLLATWQIRQHQTRRPPDDDWQALERKARAVDRTPILVVAKHGTKQGIAIAPLSWHLDPP